MPSNVRSPEPGLEVLWQRHIPAGFGDPDSDVRVDAVADLASSVEGALEAFTDDALDAGDLVVTISRRPT